MDRVESDRSPAREGLSTRCSLLDMAAIQTFGLTKEYRSRLPRPRTPTAARALDDLTLDVRNGEVFGFLGPNGAGKTTMIRLLLGFLHPTSGQATVLGLDTERRSVEIRQRVGPCSFHPTFFRRSSACATAWRSSGADNLWHWKKSNRS